MGSKLLVGAVVGALSVWCGAWKLSERQRDSLALAAPVRAELRHAAPADALESPQSTRLCATGSETLGPEALAAAVDETEPGLSLSSREIASLVADLHDDDERANARHAVWLLVRADSHAILPLEGALHSNDWQQRQLAALVLTDRPYAANSQRLADVIVKGLEQPNWPDGQPDAFDAQPPIEVFTGFEIHEHSRAVLCAYPELFALAEQGVARLLGSNSGPTRLAAARVLASQRSALGRERALAILIEHLEDNRIEGDARLALPAIAGFGAEVLPVLERHWPGRDAQQRALLGHLIWLCAPTSACARELQPADFHALGFSRWNPLPLAQRGRIE